MIALKPYAWLDLADTTPKINIAVFTTTGTTNNSIRFDTSGFDSTDPELYCYNFVCAASTSAPAVFVTTKNDTASVRAKRIAVRLFARGGGLLGSVTLTNDATLYASSAAGEFPYCYLQTTITPKLTLWVSSRFTDYTPIIRGISAKTLRIDIEVKSSTALTSGSVDAAGCPPIDLSAYDITSFNNISVQLVETSPTGVKSYKGKGTTTQTDSDSSGAD